MSDKDTNDIGSAKDPIRSVHYTVDEFVEQVRAWADGPGEFELRADRLELEADDGKLIITEDDCVRVQWESF